MIILKQFFSKKQKAVSIMVLSMFILSASPIFLKESFGILTETEILDKKDLVEFIEIVQTEPLREKIKSAKLLFEKGKKLPANYRWAFKDYKVGSRNGVIQYVFLNEEAFGNIQWKIEMHVQEATSEIVYFEANALKNSSQQNSNY